MSTSLQQKKTLEMAKKIFPIARVIENYPLGNRQFLDVYVKDFKIGIEVDGQQHSVRFHFFNKDESDFQLQKMLDKKKETICKELGIMLIRINYDEKVTKELILSKLRMVL